MDDQKNTIIKQFKYLDTIFIVMLGSQIILGVTAIFIQSNNYFPPISISDETIRIIIMAANLGLILLMKFYYSKSIAGAIETNSMNERMQKFSSLNIVRCALLKTINLLNLIAFMITGKYVYLVIFIIVLGLFFVYRSSRKIFITDFKLTGVEEELILNSNE